MAECSLIHSVTPADSPDPDKLKVMFILWVDWIGWSLVQPPVNLFNVFTPVIKYHVMLPFPATSSPNLPQRCDCKTKENPDILLLGYKKGDILQPFVTVGSCQYFIFTYICYL